MTEKMKADVEEYYGKVLGGSQDLKTSACCSIETMPSYVKEILSNIDDEILTKFYGCGSPIPLDISGKRVLDLGCGTGRDVYLFSKLVGDGGKVIGVDMTDEQLQVAKKYQEKQAEVFGLKESNVEFKKGYIEDLKSLGIEDGSLDVVTSNCVINLSPDKSNVFSEIFRVLKNGGELYFSDVFADRRIPEALKEDQVLLGECLSGALYIEDFRRILRDIGCLDYRIVSKSKIEIEQKEVEAKIGMVNFYSMTVRAFKLSNSLEDICEDYGQTATYQGSIETAPHRFILDDHHVFETGKPMLVCGNTAAMVGETRYKQHFNVTGNRERHFGPFDCGDGIQAKEDSSLGACC